ncbi:MAG: hypothetical protein AAFQ80_22030 [Cyanobacteria bacterium J06621_8]
MNTMIAIALGIGFTAWLAWRNPKITVKLLGVEIEFEPPDPPPPLIKRDGCNPGGDCNRLGDNQ